MNKKDVIEFFDRRAASWDATLVKNDFVIEKILDNAQIDKDMDILDVACGTGIMFDYYLNRNVSTILGIDISTQMVKIAADKYSSEPKVQVVCGDVEEYEFKRKFDRIVVYNALPHFPDPENLIKTLANLLNDNGRMTIAHGASRETIDKRHNGPAQKVSNGLMTIEKLKDIFEPYFNIDTVISDDKMYQISGSKR